MPDLRRWRTSITRVRPGAIEYRGTPIEEYIETASLEDAFWAILFGRPASAEQADALRRSLIAALDHSLAAPSALASRVTASTRGPIPLAIATGLIAFAGPAHGGAAEEAGKVFRRIRELGTPDAAQRVVAVELEAGRRIGGYGHPYHPNDPRVGPLLAGGPSDRTYRDIALQVQIAVEEATGRDLKMNADAAVAGLLMDAGLEPEEVTLVTALGRSFGLAAHAREERFNESPFRAPSLDTISYESSEGSQS